MGQVRNLLRGVAHALNASPAPVLVGSTARCATSGARRSRRPRASHEAAADARTSPPVLLLSAFPPERGETSTARTVVGASVMTPSRRVLASRRTCSGRFTVHGTTVTPSACAFATICSSASSGRTCGWISWCPASTARRSTEDARSSRRPSRAVRIPLPGSSRRRISPTTPGGEGRDGHVERQTDALQQAQLSDDGQRSTRCTPCSPTPARSRSTRRRREATSLLNQGT
jgi:hypothetical protein